MLLQTYLELLRFVPVCLNMGRGRFWPSKSSGLALEKLKLLKQLHLLVSISKVVNLRTISCGPNRHGNVLLVLKT